MSRRNGANACAMRSARRSAPYTARRSVPSTPTARARCRRRCCGAERCRSSRARRRGRASAALRLLPRRASGRRLPGAARAQASMVRGVAVARGHRAARRVLARLGLVRSRGPAPAAGAFTAAALLVDGRPGARLGFGRIEAVRLVALLDVTRRALLLGRVLGLVTAWHEGSSYRKREEYALGGQAAVGAGRNAKRPARTSGPLVLAGGLGFEPR